MQLYESKVGTIGNPWTYYMPAWRDQRNLRAMASLRGVNRVSIFPVSM